MTGFARMAALVNRRRPGNTIAGRRVLALARLLAVFGLLLAGRAALAESLIVHAGGSAYRFEVELATTPAEREQGLMYRQELAPNAGMLFVYPTEQPVAFWMKNTLIPLDMLFIRADGTIARIGRNAVPRDETPIPSGPPVKMVLEVKGGTSDALGIKEGDRVEFAAVPSE